MDKEDQMLQLKSTSSPPCMHQEAPAHQLSAGTIAAIVFGAMVVIITIATKICCCYYVDRH
jgi:hypothetical protein